MTQNTKKPLWLTSLVIFVGLIAIVFLWQYLAGAFFLSSVGGKFGEAKPLTYYQYWYHFYSDPFYAKKIQNAGFLALLAIGVPVGLILKPKGKTLFGDAKFASFQEIRKAGLLGDAGIIIGKFKGKFLMYASSMHAIISASTRSGKGVAVVIPNCLNWPQSLFVLDTKQEAFNLTSGYRARYGQRVVLFNPLARDKRTHRWNPLSYISDDPSLRISDIQKIANYLFPDVDGQDPLWSSSGRSLMVGVVLYLIETGKPVTLGEVYRTVTQVEELGAFFKREIEWFIKSGNPLSAPCVSALSDFIGTSDNTRASIRVTFSSRFELFLNPLIDSATSANDFDLRSIRKEKISIYLGVAFADLAPMAPLINLFIQQLIDLNTYELPESNPALKYECLLLLDEFTAFGRIPALVKGISYVAGYGLKVLPIIHDYSQLKDIYGEHSTKTFSTNLGIQIDFEPKDQDRRELISKMLGDQTWTVKNKSRSSGSKGGGSRSQNESQQRRPLMYPQEVGAIGDSRQFIFMENCRAIFCDKVKYFQEAVFMDRLKEISPTLMAMGKRLPSKNELDEVSNRGELCVPIPLLNVVIPEPLRSLPSQSSSEVKTRKLRPSDIDILDSLTLDDISCDFSDVELPGDPASDEEIEDAVQQFLSHFDK